MKELEKLKKNWKSPFVAREKLEEFSGGIINPKTMRSLDSLGKGIPEKFKIGRKVAYPVESVIFWLESRYNEK